MQEALKRSLAAFLNHFTKPEEQQVLLLISDRNSTNRDPQPYAWELQQANVNIAVVYLTADQAEPHQQLYNREAVG